MEPELFKGAVLLCPALQFDGHMILQYLSWVISSLFPRLGVPSVGEDDVGSRNLFIAETIVNDKTKSNTAIPALTGYSLLQHFKFCQANMHRMKVPFLTLHGKKDMIIKPSCSEELLQKAEVEDKQGKWYEEAWHDLLFEPEHEQVMEDIAKWIDDHA
uniref:Serine aminopeptidase S33 domain-containing protein n=2 Tax=Guillardia theta TaxID=55529 RepID=A0A7S4KXH5_GUITH|mmetsp:Transcript_33068/g.104562  ORF Transcript_33068/g.104562 Transcript_33068/m.104562 type:complete len:158 (+) Transcript_33068:658-1131(+)